MKGYSAATIDAFSRRAILPDYPPRSTLMAHCYVRDAAFLLVNANKLLMASTVRSGEVSPMVRTTSWDMGFRRYDEWDRPEKAIAMSIARRSLESAAREILLELAGRWPPKAVPSEIGVLTDGTGLLFSRDHPSPLAPGWLPRHAMCLHPVIIILPFEQDGAWSRLTLPIDGMGGH